jgi:hypothetical protein
MFGCPVCVSVCAVLYCVCACVWAGGWVGGCVGRSSVSVRSYLLPSPFISNALLASLRESLPSHTISTTYEVDGLADALRNSLQRVADDVLRAVDSGARLLVLSELDINPERGPLPLNVVVGSVNQMLQKLGLRRDVVLALECLSAIRPAHFSQLLAMGADVVNPVLLLDPRVLEENAPAAGTAPGTTNTTTTANSKGIVAKPAQLSPEAEEAALEEHASRLLAGCDEGIRHYMSTVGIGAVTA